MKKLIYLMVILLLLPPLSACKAKEIANEINLTAFVSSHSKMYDSPSVKYIKIKKSFEEWHKEAYGEEDVLPAESRVTVEFRGAKFTGNYTESRDFGPWRKHIHEYSGNGCSFSINAQTGRLTNFSFEPWGLAIKYLDDTASVEQCGKKAKEIAEQYIDTTLFELEYSQEYVYHNFTYVQYVEGKKTENKFTISFTESGRINGFLNSVAKGYDKVKELDKQYVSKLVEAVTSKEAENLATDEAKKALDGFNIAGTTVDRQRIYVLSDGRVMNYYCISVSYEAPDEPGMYTSAPVDVVVFDSNI